MCKMLLLEFDAATAEEPPVLTRNLGHEFWLESLETCEAP